MKKNAENEIRESVINQGVIFIMEFISKKEMSYFYYPDEANYFKDHNKKFINELSEEKIILYNYDVKDLLFLSGYFAEIESIIKITIKEYIPDRQSLIQNLKLSKNRKYYWLTLLMLIMKTIILFAVIIYSIKNSIEYHCIDEVYSKNFNNINNSTFYSTINDNKTLNNSSFNNTINNKTILNNSGFNNTINNNKTLNNSSFNNTINNKKTLNNSSFNNTINNKTILNDSFWYCGNGKCQVEIKKWRMAKILSFILLFGYYFLILIYEYYLLFTFKRIIINIYWILIYKLLVYGIIISIFILNYKDDKICGMSKSNKALFFKETNDVYNILILLFNFLLSLI